MDAAPDTSPRTAQIIARMGEPIFGHQAPDGYPETGESWMNHGCDPQSASISGWRSRRKRVPGATIDRWPESQCPHDGLARRSGDAVVSSILERDASPDTRAILLSGETHYSPQATPKATWRFRAAGDSGAARMDDTDDRGTVSSTARVQGLAQVVGLALGAPEFQRR